MANRATCEPPFDLDVHIALKTNSTETQTIRCWFDTCCFQGHIISKEFVASLGFSESDYVTLTPIEGFGGQMMNETIHSVEAAIRLSLHHNTGPKYRDMRFLISSTLDSQQSVIGTRSIVKHGLLSPPTFMSDAASRKNLHKKLPEKDEILGTLQHDLSEAEMSLITLESAIKKEEGPKREQLKRQRDEAKHKHDILGLQVEMRQTELNKNMKVGDRKQHIDKLRQEVANGELTEAERKAKLPQNSEKVQTKAYGSQKSNSGSPLSSMRSLDRGALALDVVL